MEDAVSVPLSDIGHHLHDPVLPYGIYGGGEGHSVYSLRCIFGASSGRTGADHKGFGATFKETDCRTDPCMSGHSRIPQ